MLLGKSFCFIWSLNSREVVRDAGKLEGWNQSVAGLG